METLTRPHIGRQLPLSLTSDLGCYVASKRLPAYHFEPCDKSILGIINDHQKGLQKGPSSMIVAGAGVASNEEHIDSIAVLFRLQPKVSLTLK